MFSLRERNEVSSKRSLTHRSPGDALDDHVLTALQVLHHVPVQTGLGLDEALDHLVEVKAVELEHAQEPGETQVRVRGQTTPYRHQNKINTETY